MKALLDGSWDEAHRPDGMAIAFLQCNWNTVKWCDEYVWWDILREDLCPLF